MAVRLEDDGSSVHVHRVKVMQLGADRSDELAFDLGPQKRRGDAGMPHELQ